MSTCGMLRAGLTYLESILLASNLEEVGSRAHHGFVNLECFAPRADCEVGKVFVVEQPDRTCKRTGIHGLVLRTL